MVARKPLECKSSFVNLLNDLESYVQKAAKEGIATHDVELELFRGILRLGHELLSSFFRIQGTGDIGATWELSDGTVLHRQPNRKRTGGLSGIVRRDG